MKPLEAIHALSAFVSYSNEKENGTRLFLIQQITKALVGNFSTAECKALIKKTADIELEFDFDITDIKPTDYCGFKEQICRVKKRKILSTHYHVMEFGNNLINCKKNVGK